MDHMHQTEIDNITKAKQSIGRFVHSLYNGRHNMTRVGSSMIWCDVMRYSQQYCQRKKFIGVSNHLIHTENTRAESTAPPIKYAYAFFYTTVNIWYGTHLSRHLNYWSLRCSWSTACRRCSNYIFFLALTPGLIGLGKGNCEKRRETFVLGFWCRLY